MIFDIANRKLLRNLSKYWFSINPMKMARIKTNIYSHNTTTGFAFVHCLFKSFFRQKIYAIFLIFQRIGF